MKQSEQKPLCVSVFKNGESTTTPKEYTKVWIELINKVERGKSVNFCKK